MKIQQDTTIIWNGKQTNEKKKCLRILIAEQLELSGRNGKMHSQEGKQLVLLHIEKKKIIFTYNPGTSLLGTYSTYMKTECPHNDLD